MTVVVSPLNFFNALLENAIFGIKPTWKGSKFSDTREDGFVLLSVNDMELCNQNLIFCDSTF